jgi:hypothetical protein
MVLSENTPKLSLFERMNFQRLVEGVYELTMGFYKREQ